MCKRKSSAAASRSANGSLTVRGMDAEEASILTVDGALFRHHDRVVEVAVPMEVDFRCWWVAQNRSCVLLNCKTPMLSRPRTIRPAEVTDSRPPNTRLPSLHSGLHQAARARLFFSLVQKLDNISGARHRFHPATGETFPPRLVS